MIDYIKAINTQLLSSFNDDSLPNNDYETRNLIRQIRASMMPAGEQIGVWEVIELNFADRALDAGFYRLALIFARQALCVTELSPEAYTFGFNLIRSQISTGENDGRSITIEEQAEHANELLRDQQMTAENLVLDDQIKSYELKLASDIAAIELRKSQIAKARDLLEKNRLKAIELADDNEQRLRIFAAHEKDRPSKEQALTNLLSEASSGYSSGTAMISTDISYSSNLMRSEQERTADNLKMQQQQAAEELEDSQLQAASELEASKARAAERLSNTQKQAAMNLVERQAVKAIRKRNKDFGDLDK